MVPKRYRTALTIIVIGALSVVGTVLFSLTVAREKPRSPPADCNSTSCQTEGTRLNDTNAACRGFYDFVCGRHRHRRPLLYQRATLALSSRLNASLSSFPALNEAFLRGSCPGHYALLGLDLYRTCMGNGVDWGHVVRLMERVGLAGWPVPQGAQPDKSPLDIAGLMDLRLGVFALARLSLRRHYGHIVMQLDRTPLPLQLHQLSVPLRTLGSYVRAVERALALLQSWAEGSWGPVASAIVELEQALERTQPRDAFVYGPRLIRFGDLPRSSRWNWAEYVAIVRDDSSLLAQPNLTLLVHEPEQLALATQLLSNASTSTLFNYLGYRVLVHLGPLLPSEADFLLPLAPWADVAPPRFAGCLRLLAHIHPFSLRFFAGLQQGQQYAPPSPGGRADELFAVAQRATAAVVEALPFRENGAGMRRGLTVLTARLDRGQSSLAARLPTPQGPSLRPAKGGFLDALVDVLSVRENAFWLATAPDNGLDSRHQVEPFSMHADYFDEPNVVHVSPALSLALQELEALGDILATAPLVDALLRAALPGEPQELLRTSPGQMRCLARRLGTSMYDSRMPDQLRQLLHPSALLEVFERSMSPPNPGRFSARQFFFVHWAITLCDAPQLQKRLRRYKMVPTRVRVDVTLANHAAFHGAWTCPAGTPMHRSNACPPLTR